MTKSNYLGVVSTTPLVVMAALLFGLLIIITATTKPAHAATTFTVNSPGDRGDQSPGDGRCATGEFIFNVGEECTLRAAIEEANAFTGADTINFAIPGAGPHTISPGSELPPITQRVTIDGYTEALDEGFDPAKVNTATTGTSAVLKIVLDGTNAGFVSGLRLSGTGASNSVIRGLVINDFFSFSIRLVGGKGYKVEGNFIGTDPSGTTAEGNSSGVDMQSSNSTIGGTSPDKRNLISGNSPRGIQVGGEGGNKIEGNLIGTKADGTSPLGNGSGPGDHGVIVFSPSNTIGDSDPSDGATNAANTIASNAGGGVAIAGTSATGNRILSNSIFSNGQLGIQLFGGTEDANGVTANDDKDPDKGPNRLQNYPVITSAQVPFGFGATIEGELNSTPSTREKKRTFTIQFFSSPAADSPSGFGEGKTFLGERKVTTNRQGNAPISFFAPAVSEGEYITATATNKKTGDTSEFSEAKRVVQS